VIGNKVELGLLANIKTGKLDANASVDGGKYPFFTCSKKPLQIDDYSFDGNYVLVAGNGDLNVKHYVGKFDAYQRTYAIQTDQDKLFPRYLYYFLNKYVEVLRNLSIGGVIKYIKLGNLTGAKIPLPPLAEQKKIAAILDAADRLRQKDAQLIAKYNTLSQSLFLDMFGDPVTNPMGWDMMRFDGLVADDCPLTYGIVQPGDEFDNGTPVVRPVDLTTRYIQLKTLKRINADISNKFQRTILKGGEILLSVRGSVGVASFALPELSGANVTRGIAPIWMDITKMSNNFTFDLLQSTGIQREIKRLAKGATLIQINLKDLREMKIICPPITLQNQFAERIQAIEAQKQQAQASLQKSEDLFNSLLQRAFKGELTT